MKISCAGREILLETNNLSKKVIWSPWKESLSNELKHDYHDKHFETCICVEPGQVSGDTFTLVPGGVISVSQKLTIAL